jgi:hypothetical protein
VVGEKSSISISISMAEVLALAVAPTTDGGRELDDGVVVASRPMVTTLSVSPKARLANLAARSAALGEKKRVGGRRRREIISGRKINDTRVEAETQYLLESVSIFLLKSLSWFHILSHMACIFYITTSHVLD